ncbi:MAG TPA: LysR family transcriptional regulator [Polyangiaceae bacterium]
MARLALSNVNLNLLVALDALLATRSVSDAARRVRVTKSALSHSLAALRGLFEDPLLVRAGGRMVLTPYAESLREPLGRVLGGVTQLLEGAQRFDPASAARRFVIAAPDFFATLILPPILEVLRAEAPGIELSIVPSARRGNAWFLENGEFDLALGAVVEDAPGIRRAELCTETFACAVRKEHPEVREALTLEAYTRLPHLVIALGDDDRPTWIDEALAKKGRERRVAVRVRYFMTAPLVVARTDLVLTAPAMLVDYFAKLVPLEVFEPPIALPTYPEEAYWHERYDADPAHRWLRELIARVTAKLGTGTRPERTRWSGEMPKVPSKRRPKTRTAKR